MDEVKMRRAIEVKREGGALQAADWHEIVAAHGSGAVDDAQMTALLMTCVSRGMDLHEIVALTEAMVNSGRTLRHERGVPVVDKHSSGGVGDIVSLVVVPLVAACGVNVAKLSGRALGHTGGTIDKLETIPGFNAALPLETFVAQVARVGCAIAAQSDEIVPADKRLYRLRDRTGTIPAKGLIAASIVSKKVAGGADAFVFDVKCGAAAFMQQPEDAMELARLLAAVSRGFGREARAIVTDMNEPLGRAIGPAIEVIEARDVLRGIERDERILAACLEIAEAMLQSSGVTDSRTLALRSLEDGRAYEKFVAMIEAQGSTRRALEEMSPHPDRRTIVSTSAGFVASIDAVLLGNVARHVSERESQAGMRLRVRIGDPVEAGEVLAETYGSFDVESIRRAFHVGEHAPPVRPLVHGSA